ncbi:type II secretion system secretin GspD [Desulfuromonas thiophila]|uniref:General secretion pathway protein D n=1 Tax=Desulfuromonas thiophila TaxID=57664 RepID=A0A1G6XVL0_9BACT|nr:type II secretion system secretin GspD [Desulfuromonas thiophila]MDY0397094.1 type II secretion system secretin GspD [Desulfuromonas thiophila]SDD82264.1 general secretion pathway protein D [Desulfuromonas thiophila]
MKLLIRQWVLILAACGLLLSDFTMPPRAAAEEAAITLDFKDIELTELIQTISALTGRNFVYDESIRGKATIISSEPMTRQEAYRLFLTVLNIKGYTVVPSGATNKIVSTRDAKEVGLPTLRAGEASDQFVTRMLTLRHINAADVAESILSPLMPKTSNVVVYEPSNKLIISDNAANIARLVSILRELDVPLSQHQLKVVSLRYADATETAKICNEILATGPARNLNRRRSTNVTTSATTAESKVLAYDRTNRLILMASSEDMTSLLQLIAEVDQQPVREHARIHVYYLENADAETLSTTLNEILSGVKAAPAPTGTTDAAKAADSPIKTQVSVTADKATNALVVNATPEDYSVIREIIRQLDIRRKQVYVEALIMELSMEATQKLGLGLQGGFEIGDEGVVGISSNMEKAVSADLLTNAVQGIMAGGFSKLISYTDPASGETLYLPAFAALLQLSKTDGDVNILSAPRLLTTDNEEAEIIVGSNVPIITQRLTDTGGSDSLAQSVAIERKDVALTLRFKPQTTEGNLVRLTIYQETTDLASTNVGNVDQVGPTFTTRKLTNTVLARNGQTVVLGGLISTNLQENKSRVPLLGDIPLLGLLFRSSSLEEKKTNMVVFITPTVIGSQEELDRISDSNRAAFDELRRANETETN